MTKGYVGKLLLATIVMGMFLDGLDSTIVTVALPSIAETMHMDASTSSWINTIYLITISGLILPFGKISSGGSLKKVLVCGFAVFALGSLCCGLSQDIATMLLFRAVQGIGGAMLASSSIMLGINCVPPERRAFALSLSVIGSSVGSAIGPALGGVILQYMSWEWVYFVNVPIGVASMVMAYIAVPKDKEHEKKKLDLIGTVLTFATIMLGTFVIERGISSGLNTTTVCAIALGLVFLAAMIFYELRADDPIVDLRLFKHSNFRKGAELCLILDTTFTGLDYLLPFFMAIVMGLDTISMGLLMMLEAAVTAIVCAIVERRADGIGIKKMVATGMVSVMMASLLFALMGQNDAMYLLISGLILMGFLLALAGGPIGKLMVNGVPESKRDDASPIYTLCIYIGCSIGMALYAGLFEMFSPAKGVPIEFLSPGDFLMGFSPTMMVSVVIAAISLIILFLYREERRV